MRGGGIEAVDEVVIWARLDGGVARFVASVMVICCAEGGARFILDERCARFRSEDILYMFRCSMQPNLRKRSTEGAYRVSFVLIRFF